LKVYRCTDKVEKIIKDYCKCTNIPVTYTITYPIDRGELATELALFIDSECPKELEELLNDYLRH